jgi:hypothetical protein
MSHNVYGVTTEEVALEMPALFPDGFSPTTKPADSVVDNFIDTADTVAHLRVSQLSGLPADSAAEAAIIARRYVLNWTIAKVLRIVYMRDPAAADAAARPYESAAKELYASFDILAELLASGVTTPNTRGGISDRPLLIPDAALGEGARGGSTARLF